MQDRQQVSNAAYVKKYGAEDLKRIKTLVNAEEQVSMYHVKAGEKNPMSK